MDSEVAGGPALSDEEWRARSRSRAPRAMLARRLLWSVVQGTLYRGSFHTFDGWRAWLLRLFGATVGPRCTIRRTSRVFYPWNLTMGTMSCLADRVEVYNLGPVTIGDRVVISQEAYLCAGTHDHRFKTMPLLTPPVSVGDDAWVCARAFVGPGVTVGPGAIVAAGAVALRDVAPWTIVVGNPATFLKKRERPR
jgi:putative colanic acid biosynthesis acetyltransferase WcaF